MTERMTHILVVWVTRQITAALGKTTERKGLACIFLREVEVPFNIGHAELEARIM